MKKIALVLFGLAATACGIENTNSSIKQQASGPVRRIANGKSADALFDAMRNAGIRPEQSDGRIIVVTTSISAEGAYCKITMNATQDAECQFRKEGESFAVKDAALAKRAALVLDQAGAKTMHAIYGVNNYEASKLLCTRGNGPFSITRCEFEVAKRPDDNASPRKEISGDQAKILHNALESAGVAPETVDGRPILGAVTLKADEVSCKQTFDANLTKECEVSKAGRSLGAVEAGLLEGLIAMLDEQGANVNPQLIGASTYVIRKVECVMTVLAEPTYNCSFEVKK
ncbi:MAG: hypothetical protein RIQ81_2435 [Pseudomonadota bacterium]